MKAMILAAGLGTRLKPWTDMHPKALALVNGKTLLERQVRYLQKVGIVDLVVNVHHLAAQVVHAIEDNNGWGSNISVSHEVDNALETGGGLKRAAHLLGHSEDIVLLNVDVLTDLDLGKMLSYHQRVGGIATLAVSDRDTSRYFLFDDQLRLSGWSNINTGVEKVIRDVSVVKRKAFSGIHIIKPKIFPLLPRAERFSMVDVYLEIGSANPVYGYDHSGGIFLDVGKPSSLERAQQLAAQL